MSRFLLPLALFLVLAVFFAIGLTKDPKHLPSALLDKPAPAFNLPQLAQPQSSFSPEDMKGKVWMLNVWASWCASCRQEHPLFMQFARSGEFTNMVGLNYKDKRQDAQQWLRQLGDPYLLSAVDLKGDVGIDFGVYGVPESFIIDKQGIVRYRHAGPISRQLWNEELKPLIKQLEES